MVGELIQGEIDFTALSGRVYEEIGWIGGHVSYDDIARDTSCLEAAPRTTDELNNELVHLGHIGVEAHSELHQVSIKNDSWSHNFSVIPDDEEVPDHDMVVDLAYKQHLPDNEATALPNVFVGSRRNIIILMRQHSHNPSAAALYEVGSLVRTY